MVSGFTPTMQRAQQRAAARGKNLHFVAGDNLFVNGVEARAYIQGDDVYVRVDHALFDSDQLTRHKLGHDMIAKGEIDLNDVRERLERVLGSDGVQNAAAMYAAAYAGANMTTNEIFEEIVCDSLGDMNVFSTMMTLENQAAEVLRATSQAVQESREQNADRTRGPPSESTGAETKFSIETLPDGKKYVKADRQVIFGNDPESWSEQLERYINGKIRKGEDVELITEDGDTLRITKDTAGKISSQHQNGRTLSEDYYSTKVNAGAQIDELLTVSKRGTDKPDREGKHGRWASKGWNYRTAYFEDFDGRYYKLKISIAQNETGNIVYNIGDIKEETPPQRDQARITGSKAKGRDVSADIISNSSNSVKPKFSRDIDFTYQTAVDSGDKAEQQRLVDEAAEKAFGDSKIRTETGELMKVRHGTKEEFNVFDTSVNGGKNDNA